MLKYKNYTATLEIDLSSNLLRGHVIDLDDAITFQARTPNEAKEEFHRAVDSYLAACQVIGKKPEKPFSGKLPFRTTAEVHKSIYLAAKYEGKSINTWMVDVLRQEAQATLEGRRESDRQTSEEVPRLSVSSYFQEHPEAFDILFEQLTEFFEVGGDRDRSLFRSILEQLIGSMTMLKKIVKDGDLKAHDELIICKKVLDQIRIEVTS